MLAPTQNPGKYPAQFCIAISGGHIVQITTVCWVVHKHWGLQLTPVAPVVKTWEIMSIAYLPDPVELNKDQKTPSPTEKCPTLQTSDYDGNSQKTTKVCFALVCLNCQSGDAWFA